MGLSFIVAEDASRSEGHPFVEGLLSLRHDPPKHAVHRHGIWRRGVGTIRPGGSAMTKTLKKAFEAASRLAAREQDELAVAILEELGADERWEVAFARSQDALEAWPMRR
jgi:hypothetical protein